MTAGTLKMHPANDAALCESVRFQPSPREWRLFDAYLAVLGEGGRVTNAALGARMVPPMKESAMRMYRTRHPEADSWVREQIHATIAQDRPLVLRRLLELALRGSAEHARLLAQICGWFAPTDRGGDPNVPGGQGVQIRFYGLPAAEEQEA